MNSGVGSAKKSEEVELQNIKVQMNKQEDYDGKSPQSPHPLIKKVRSTQDPDCIEEESKQAPATLGVPGD